MPRARARQAGLALASDLSEESFADFLLRVSKKPKGGIEGVGELTRQQLLNVCTALASHVEKALPAAIGIGLEGNTQASEEAILTLHGAAVLALELLTRSQQLPPEQLLNAAVMLHDGVLISNLDPELEKLQVEMQDAVMRLCCTWWERQLPGNDFLVARTIPYVLLRAIQNLDHNRASMVHMCYVIRDALELLDFEDETIRDTKRLLLMAAMHPSFLREPEGRRFIAGLFKLEPQMTRELGAIVRNQIPSGQRFALEAYGEILFRAWRDTVGPCAVEVESEVQGLMQAAILASTPALAAALRVVLDGLHSQKALEKSLNPAFVRLYDPILPRAFGAANAEVRRNAVHLLVAAFPIIDPEAPAEVNNVRLTQQMGFLIDSLADACPVVREAGVEGCCRCLKYFWEIIPAATSAKIIGDITGKLAFDGSSRAVRIAVLRGLCKLVDSQHAQPVLKKALPGISGLLRDNDSGVREALADLLVAISGTRGLNLWGVAPAEELLEVIAVDRAPAVARKISRMLVPSFFPNAQEGSARLGALLRSRPEAGLSFCCNLVARFYPSEPRVGRARGASSTEFTASVPVEQILQLTHDLAAHLLATAPRLGSNAAHHRQQQQQEQQQLQAKKQAKAAGGGGNKTGKKRAKKKAPAPQSGSEGGGEARKPQARGIDDVGADNGVAAAGRRHAEDDEEDVVLQDGTAETEEGWLGILEGLAAVADGLAAAALHAEECSEKDLEAALPVETLGQLLEAAEEQLRKPQAVKLVLQIVASVHFTTGALRVRTTLFERLAAGALPGCSGATGDNQTMELDGHAGPQDADVGVLSQVLKTLATGSNGPKLLALLAAALGVRQPLPLRKPVASKKAAKGAAASDNKDGRNALHQLLGGGSSGCGRGVGLNGHGRSGDGDDGDDGVLCLGCRCAEPADTMLLCDGCDAPCHTHCLRPALQEVPEDAWFCWHCESQLQAVKLPPAAAGRCVCLLLQHEEGRSLMSGYPGFGVTIQAMQRLALAEADEIFRLAQAGAVDEADSPPAEVNAAAEAGCTVLLGDPWGALARYCRAALHRAMAALWQQSVGGGSAVAADAASALPTPRRTPGSAVRKRRGRGDGGGGGGGGGRRATASESGGKAPAPPATDAADAQEPLPPPPPPFGAREGEDEDALSGFFEVVPILELAMQASGHLTELVLAEPCLAAQLAALQYSQGLLRVLHVVHQTELLNMSGQYVSTVSCLCNAQAVLTHTVLSGVANHQGRGTTTTTSSVQYQVCVSATLQVLLGLALQMAEAVRTCPAAIPAAPAPAGIRAAAGPGAKDGEARPSPSQQLTARAEALAGSASSEGGTDTDTDRACEGQEELPPPGVALDSLLASLVALLCHAAVEPFLEGPVRAGAAMLLGELLATTRKVTSGGWLGTLCKLAGQALATDPGVTEGLQEALRAQDAVEGGEDGGAAAAAAAAADGNGDGARGGHEDEIGEVGPAAAAAAGARAVRRRAQGGGQKKVAATASGIAAATVLQAAALKVSELLRRESPAVGTVATVLVRVCVARKVHGRAMLLLARMATKALGHAATAAGGPWPPEEEPSTNEPGPDGAEAYGVLALGATALLTMCQAVCPDAAAAAAEVLPDQCRQPAVGQARGARRYGMLAQEAAAQAARAESEAVVKAFEVLRRAVVVVAPHRQGQGQGQGGQQQQAADGDAAEAEAAPIGLLQAQLLARQLVSGFAGAAVSAQ